MLLISALAFTCNVEDDLEAVPKPDRVKSAKIPFTPEDVEQALANVAARSNGRIKIQQPSATHNYVRFEPQNLNQVMRLQDLGYDLWDVPLEQDIEYEGDYYQQPGLPDSLNYFYTLIPANYTIVNTVPHTVISQVILFNEDAGDEQDPEEDPWIPDPDNCPDPYNPNCPCYEGPCARVSGNCASDVREDLLKKTTRYLMEQGVDLKELYNEIMRLAGHEDELIGTNASGRTQSHRYFPQGYIRVLDNSINTTVGVKQVMVKARRFFKMGTVWTDDAGYYFVNKGFRNKATLFVKFKNFSGVVRGINGAVKLWQLVTPVRKKLGTFEKTAMQNGNFTFGYSSNANNISALQFAAAHCLNTLSEMRQYCQNHNLIGYAPGTEYRANIWISSAHTQSASAPMLRALTSSLKLNAIDYLFPEVGAAAKGIILNYSPDVTLRLQNSSGDTRSAADLSAIFFHEFAHALHGINAGPFYWVNLIIAIVSNGGYGFKTSHNAGHVAVAESWGFFLGPTFQRNKYSSHSGIAVENLNFLERQRNNDLVPVSGYNASLGYSEGWIPWGMHHDLIDVGEPAITLITDQVSGYTIEGIFKGFHQGSTTVQNLRAAILAKNGNSQATQVNTLVSGYGW